MDGNDDDDDGVDDDDDDDIMTEVVIGLISCLSGDGWQCSLRKCGGW